MSDYEPGACLSLWPTEECEWSTWDIWRSADVVERAIDISLTLMLLYTFFLFARYLFHHYRCRHELCDPSSEFGTDGLRTRRRLVSELNPEYGIVKGISTAAPFFGLAGTSYGILSALWFPYSGSPQRYVALLFTRIAFAFATTIAGILVALPSTIFRILVSTRIERFSGASSSNNPIISKAGSFRFAETLPLGKRFSSLPPFALIAAPALASVIALFTPFHPSRVPVGLRVLLPSFPRRPNAADRIIVLHVGQKGELFINTEPVSRTDLPQRLSAIYRMKAGRDLYLLAESGASFQTVADAIDTATRIRAPEFNSLGINVLLITPQAEPDIKKCLDRPWQPSVRSRR